MLEGLWLLFDQADWGKVNEQLDKTFYIDDVAEESMMHTIMRHMWGGKTNVEANRYYEESDVKNRELVVKTKPLADQVLKRMMHFLFPKSLRSQGNNVAQYIFLVDTFIPNFGINVSTRKISYIVQRVLAEPAGIAQRSAPANYILFFSNSKTQLLRRYL